MCKRKTNSEWKNLHVVGDKLLQKFRHLLLALNQQLHQLRRNGPIPIVIKRRGQSRVPRTRRSSNPMDIIINIIAQVIIDDMHDVLDIQSSRGNSGGDQDGAPTGFEGFQGQLAFTLASVAMKGDAGEMFVVKDVVEVVGFAFGVDKDEGARRWLGEEEFFESVFFVVFFYLDHLLHDVCRCASDSFIIWMRRDGRRKN